MSIPSAINELASQLSCTGEFLDLKKSKAVIERNPELSKLINMFQDKQASLYSPKLSQNQLGSLMNEIEAEYERLSAFKDINKYFMAVDSFNKVMNGVTLELNRVLESML